MDLKPATPHLALPNVPAVGDVIAEKYRVEGILGVGGMGVVLGARHLQLGQTVAIKVLSVGKDREQDAVDRFLREGRAAAALSCDHVVRIYDVGQLPSGIPFMVMERLRGKDLSTLLAEFGPLSVADAVEYVAQATLAIIEAHEVGIIHRDLKPSNLFLTLRSDGSPCVKVLDFGISKYLSETDAQTLRGNLTTTRQVMGSPAYMSPEQVRDAKSVDHRTDIWALGVTLYELLTRCPAFNADTLPAICAAIVADAPMSVRARRPEVPDGVEAIVARCLEKLPANRFGSARELLTDLRRWQGKTLERDRQVDAGAVESGERAEAHDGTLVSGKGPALLASYQAEPVRAGDAATGIRAGTRNANTAASLTTGRITAAVRGSGEVVVPLGLSANTLRYRSALAGAGLVLVGATTVWFFGNRDFTTLNGELSAQPQTRPAQPAGTDATARFVLHVESNPSDASVFEGATLLGATPLDIEIDRALVRQAARNFVVRKPGFVEVSIRQADSATDVRQSVSLANEEPEAKLSGAATHSAASAATKKRVPIKSTSSSAAAAAAAAPQIRTTR